MVNKETLDKLRAELKEYNKPENRINRIREVFENMKEFKTTDDIPDIPVVRDPVFYDEVIVKNLIRCGAIPKDRLTKGKKYKGDGRGCCEAVWNGEVFIYNRYKFGRWFEDEMNHFQDDDGYAVFVPLEEIKDKETTEER